MARARGRGGGRRWAAATDNYAPLVRESWGGRRTLRVAPALLDHCALCVVELNCTLAADLKLSHKRARMRVHDSLLWAVNLLYPLASCPLASSTPSLKQAADAQKTGQQTLQQSASRCVVMCNVSACGSGSGLWAVGRCGCCRGSVGGGGVSWPGSRVVSTCGVRSCVRHTNARQHHTAVRTRYVPVP